MYDTYDEVAQLGIRDPDFTKYLKARNLENMTSFAQLPGFLDPDSSTGRDQGTVIPVPMRDGTTNPLRLHKPPAAAADPARPSPLIVLLYGGGFVWGDNTQSSPLARVLARLHRATVVQPTYRLAPTHRFPTAAHDVWDAIEWLADPAGDASRLLGPDVDLSAAGFVVGGLSAGANLAAVTAQAWISARRTPALSGLHLGCPGLFEGGERHVPAAYRPLWFSREQNADALITGTAVLERVLAAYAPDTASPEWNPVNAGEEHSLGFPKTFVGVAGDDPLRDDGLVYWRILRDKGTETRLDVAPGVPHGHTVFKGLEAATKSNVEAVRAYGWMLGDEKTDQEIMDALEKEELI
ncbi:alpha beta hydrolase fold-3 domain-containing protein [Diplodia corticola]|uniref:Alpha beta hydrolase fold-3 domain-containing protein n=1 Tax=Diplodia corticola TaxID=236234 RepID=A0A1J9RMU8_9PEZI|nr:alpha beta hydrolase fold-3 domain-containing protein [Diplodia corticola]OJD29236.1 alpha beta hydrolase fold-3 domain-containing protein [Diplodia corticola]